MAPGCLHAKSVELNHTFVHVVTDAIRVSVRSHLYRRSGRRAGCRRSHNLLRDVSASALVISPGLP